jgi:hypothetical protein
VTDVGKAGGDLGITGIFDHHQDLECEATSFQVLPYPLRGGERVVFDDECPHQTRLSTNAAGPVTTLSPLILFPGE